MPDPVIHHIGLCVKNAELTLLRLQKFGFLLYAQRLTPSGKELVARLNKIFFVITEKNKQCQNNSPSKNLGYPVDSLVCCQNSSHDVDSVFNIAFSVKKSEMKRLCERIRNYTEIIQAPSEITDENGTISYCVVRSNCGNVIHTLLSVDDYKSDFLPGYEIINHTQECEFTNQVCGIDHVTLACASGGSSTVIEFYEHCFGMKRFKITSNDDETNGLIISDGVGLRLRAMQYWRCSETGLLYEEKNAENSFLLVVVESLEGQTNCNVEEFLKNHKKDGVEHIAFKSSDITDTVLHLKQNGVVFRNPPRAYYDELRSQPKFHGFDLSRLQEFGILLDNEDDSLRPEKKYLMQIFAKPLFNEKTFFIEIIQRSGAKGLGSGNILALVRSIREEERRNKMKSEAKTQEIIKENFTSPRQC